MSPARDLIARLEAQSEATDALTARLIDDLKTFAIDADSLEDIERHVERQRSAMAGIIVEAAAVLAEKRNGTPLRRTLGLDAGLPEARP